MKTGLVESIKARGYWRINFQPLESSEGGALTLKQCEEVVRKNAVSLRGWDYPHFPQSTRDDSGLELLDGCVQGWIDWSDHREFWRMYESSQFLHYRAIHEDLAEFAHHFGMRGGLAQTWSEEEATLGVISNLWLISEVTEFLSRLVTASGLYDGGVRLSIQLHSTAAKRTLTVDDARRMPFYLPRTTHAPVISYESEHSAAEVSEPRVLAVKIARYFFDRFGWDPSEEQLVNDIEQLYRL